MFEIGRPEICYNIVYTETFMVTMSPDPNPDEEHEPNGYFEFYPKPEPRENRWGTGTQFRSSVAYPDSCESKLGSESGIFFLTGAGSSCPPPPFDTVPKQKLKNVENSTVPYCSGQRTVAKRASSACLCPYR